MSLSIGIVGLPNVGKSTLFNALTQKEVDAQNYPFCTIDPSVGVVPVPDERLHALSRFSNSKEEIPAVVEFVDIAGLVKGASRGEGLGNAFLSNIREVDAIAHVVRVFDDENITHVSGKVSPRDDIEVINLELILADLSTVTARLTSIEKDVKKADKKAAEEEKILLRIKEGLENDTLVNALHFEDKEKPVVKALHLLTEKPVLYVLNKMPETSVEDYDDLLEFITDSGAEYVVVNAHIEEDLKDFEKDEKKEFRTELGEAGSGLDDFIQKSYELLDLITYFTTGEKETRAWTTEKDSTAPEAGRAIHSDFHDKFIRADVIEWDKLLEAGSRAEARDKGLIRTEGKEYIVKDGDVIEFKI